MTSSVDAVAEVRGEQGEHRAHPLAAGVQQVAAGDVGDLVGETDLAQQAGLDLVEPGVDRLRQGRGRLRSQKMRSLRPSCDANGHCRDAQRGRSVSLFQPNDRIWEGSGCLVGLRSGRASRS